MAPKKYNIEKVLGLKDEQLPKHIAIIMDGNGRWAKLRGQPRFHGHREGVKTVKRIVLEASAIGIQNLTLYSFSTENWKRPREEIEMLMHLCALFLEVELPTMMENNIKLKHVGREQELPEQVLNQLHHSMEATSKNTGMTLALALNYSARVELTDATRTIAQMVADGKLKPDQIDQRLIERNLFTYPMPDPDLMIRTADEKRLSNFMLWQLSYSEFYIAKVLWPDFHETHLRRAIKTYANRDRRYGGLSKLETGE